MPSRIHNCLFCDSARHTHLDCTTNINGRRKVLETCMLMTEMPDFQSYTKKELKFVSHITPHTNTTIRTLGQDEYEYEPIPLTLCTSKRANALQTRWETLQNAKKQHKHPICNDGCSICSGKRRETYNWSIEHGEWIMANYDSLYDNKTISKCCGQTFCTPCWVSRQCYCSHYEIIDKILFPDIRGVSMGRNKVQAFVHYQQCPGCDAKAYVEEWYDRVRRDAR